MKSYANVILHYLFKQFLHKTQRSVQKKTRFFAHRKKVCVNW